MSYLLASFQLFSLIIVAPIAWVVYTALYIAQLLSPGRRPKAPKSILITGASSGIGLELAKYYAAPGVSLALTGRKKEGLETANSQCTAKGAKVTLGVLDVSDSKSMEEFIVKYDEEHPVDLVIANAGVTEGSSGTQTDIVAASRALFSTNINGVANTLLPLIPRMKERKTGQIAIMSSLTGYGGIPALTAYSASKTAVKAYGEGLRGLLYRDGIFVNVVCPGYVESPMTDIETKGGRKLSSMVKMSTAIKYIVNGLKHNVAVISFPFNLYFLTWLSLCVFPPNVRDVFAKSRLIGHIAYFGTRKEKRGGGDNKAKAA
jgi:short-subunit dehydrogenase